MHAHLDVFSSTQWLCSVVRTGLAWPGHMHAL